VAIPFSDEIFDYIKMIENNNIQKSIFSSAIEPHGNSTIVRANFG
jgi:hypothetical protein